MKSYVISLHQHVSQKLISRRIIFALSLEEARQLARETFRPIRGQWVGAQATQNKLINKKQS